MSIGSVKRSEGDSVSPVAKNLFAGITHREAIVVIAREQLKYLSQLSDFIQNGDAKELDRVITLAADALKKATDESDKAAMATLIGRIVELAKAPLEIPVASLPQKRSLFGSVKSDSRSETISRAEKLIKTLSKPKETAPLTLERLEAILVPLNNNKFALVKADDKGEIHLELKPGQSRKELETLFFDILYRADLPLSRLDRFANPPKIVISLKPVPPLSTPFLAGLSKIGSSGVVMKGIKQGAFDHHNGYLEGKKILNDFARDASRNPYFVNGEKITDSFEETLTPQEAGSRIFRAITDNLGLISPLDPSDAAAQILKFSHQGSMAQMQGSLFGKAESCGYIPFSAPIFDYSKTEGDTTVIVDKDARDKTGYRSIEIDSEGNATILLEDTQKLFLREEMGEVPTCHLRVETEITIPLADLVQLSGVEKAGMLSPPPQIVDDKNKIEQWKLGLLDKTLLGGMKVTGRVYRIYAEPNLQVEVQDGSE